MAIELDLNLFYLDSVRLLLWSISTALLDEIRGSRRVFGERVTVERSEIGGGEIV